MSEAVELGKLALEICKREVRGFDERGASLQTDIHAAVFAALNHGEGEPVAWRARNYTEDAWTLLSDRDGRRHYRRVEALYTRPQPVAWPDREAVARAINPTPFTNLEATCLYAAGQKDRAFWVGREWSVAGTETMQGIQDAYAKADRVIALLSPSDGAGQVGEEG